MTVLIVAFVLAWPMLQIEVALRSVPAGADAVLVEDLTRGERLCWAGACLERLRVWRSERPFAVRCDDVEAWIDDVADTHPVRRLDIGAEGFARCGWIVERGEVRLGVVVEEQRPGSDLIVTSRR